MAPPRSTRSPDRALTDAIRTPPHSVEAEQAVLGSLLLDSTAWDAIADIVSAADFYRRDHRLIFEAVAEVVELRGPCDAVTVAEHLERKGLAGETGGLAYLGTLARDTPSAANVRSYAEIVRERSILRQLAEAGGQIAGAAFDSGGRSATELVDEAERRVFEIAERGSRTRAGFQAIKEVLPATIDRLDLLHQNPGQITGVTTGFTELDRMTAGLQPGDLVIVAGRPSMGKTTLAINIAENAAVGRGVPAAVFSMEMSAEQLTMRMISSLGRVNQGHLRTGQFSDEDWSRINGAIAQLSAAPIFVDETPSLTPTEVRARARRLKREKGLGLIVVDYLQLMQVAGSKENRATEISEISRGLKALAKELHVPVIALSQLNRGVEQRTEKKPVMSDLRECVTGDTLVCLADGRRVPIRALVGQCPRLWAVGEGDRIVAAHAEIVWSVGRRTVKAVALASGRVLRATGRHRVLTGRGWQQVDDVQPGERVALARQVPAPEQTERWPDEAVVLLGHLVGDGSYLKGQPLRYTTASEENGAAVRAAAESLGSRVARHAGRGRWHQLVISGNGSRWQPAGVGAWLKQHGIFGQRSHEKRLPEGAFRLDDAQVALLLRHLWATDGCIHVRAPGQKGAPRVYFSTSSAGLAGDVAALLMRLGIVARIRSVAQRGYRPCFTVDVSGAESQATFLARVGAFGPRAEGAQRLSAWLRARSSGTNVDTLPREAFADVRAAMVRAGVSQRRMAALRGTSYGGSSHFRFDPGRQTLASYAELLDDPALRRWLESDLFWDRVVSVTEAGEEEVFDLTVPGPASWLADGVVSHNSGAIEQDADVIMMIYREEVYEPNTTRKGIADIIIAKQRNGPVGEVHLTFLGEYTRFENLVPESYGEGVF